MSLCNQQAKEAKSAISLEEETESKTAKMYQAYDFKCSLGIRHCLQAQARYCLFILFLI